MPAHQQNRYGSHTIGLLELVVLDCGGSLVHQLLEAGSVSLVTGIGPQGLAAINRIAVSKETKDMNCIGR